MPGIVHNDLAGTGKLGKNGTVVPVLIDGKHSVDLRAAAHNIGRLEIGKGEGLDICRAARAWA